MKREMARMKKLIILGVILMIISMIPMAAAVITVDGHKSPGEWDSNWTFGQTEGSDYSAVGPFGDRLVMMQGAFITPQTGVWNDDDPQDDSGTNFDESMSTAGVVPSGYDIKSMSMRYDPATDTMYGLGEVYGTPGDLDGDGDVSEDDTVNGDAGGAAGPAGFGIGSNESWEIRASQNGNDVFILVSNNDWSVFNGLPFSHDDVQASFSTSGVEPVYEIAIMGMSTHFDVTPGANPIMIEVKAGGGRDIPGEDTATAFVHIPNPVIDIEKSTNGEDADSPRGPTLNMGAPVVWEYVITNTGDVPLSNIVVTDDKEGNVLLPQTTLDPQESMIATVNGQANNFGQYANEAVVTGQYNGIPVSDSDPSHYYVNPPTEVPALTPAGLLGLIGVLGIIGIVGLKRRD